MDYGDWQLRLSVTRALSETCVRFAGRCDAKKLIDVTVRALVQVCHHGGLSPGRTRDMAIRVFNDVLMEHDAHAYDDRPLVDHLVDQERKLEEKATS